MPNVKQEYRSWRDSSVSKTLALQARGLEFIPENSHLRKIKAKYGGACAFSSSAGEVGTIESSRLPGQIGHLVYYWPVRVPVSKERDILPGDDT